MELIDLMSAKHWKKSDGLLETGFKRYTIIHAEKKGDGEFVYAVKRLASREEDIQPEMLGLTAAAGKKDPLHDVKNCMLKVLDKAIVGIDLDGECVVRQDNIA